MPTPARRHPALRRLGLLALVVLALAAAATQLPLGSWRHGVTQWGVGAPIAVVGLGALLIAALVPRTAVSLACGALFGTFAGFWYALAAAAISAGITYAAGHWAGRELLCARAGSRLHRLDSWLARRGLLAVVVVRLLPLAPYGLIGYAYGTTTVRKRDYLIGTMIGAAPSCFSYAFLGSAVTTPGAISPLTFIPAALGMLVSSAAAWHWRRSSKAAANVALPAPRTELAPQVVTASA